MFPKAFPARQGDEVVKGVDLRRQIAGEGRAVIEKERDAMVGVAGRVQDFSGNPDLAEELAAPLDRDDDVAVRGDIDVVIPRLYPGLHDGDGVRLNIEHEQRNALPLHFLGQSGVVDMIVGGKRVANLAQGMPIRLRFAFMIPRVPGQPMSTSSRELPALMTQ